MSHFCRGANGSCQVRIPDDAVFCRGHAAAAERIITRRTLTFTAPPPNIVGERCERSAELLTEIANRLRDAEDEGRLAFVDGTAEQLRGVIVDLVLAAGYLKGATAE